MGDEVMHIYIEAAEDTPAQARLLAEFTTIRRGISALPVANVRSGTLQASPGSKATNAIDISHLVVTLVPTAALIGGITRICVERIRAGATREVHLKVGDHELRLTGLDAAREAEALESWTLAVLDKGSSE